MMKQLFKTTLFLPLVLTSSILIAQDGPKERQSPPRGQTSRDSQQTIIGKVTRSSNDGSYVLLDTAGIRYQLDNQGAAKRFAGKVVKVLGTMDTSSNTIHVAEINSAA